MTDTPKKPRKGAGRVAFVARLDQTREMLMAGYAQRAIYDEYGGGEKLGISYTQFNRYVGFYITGGKDGTQQRNDYWQRIRRNSSPAIPEVPENPSPDSSAPDEKDEKTVQKQPVFHHDPNSGNTRDDLI